MKEKVWLVKDDDGYHLFKRIPIFDDLCGLWNAQKGSDIIIQELCPRLVKKYFGLNRHLKNNEIVEGVLTVEFRKKGKS